MAFRPKTDQRASGGMGIIDVVSKEEDDIVGCDTIIGSEVWSARIKESTGMSPRHLHATTASTTKRGRGLRGYHRSDTGKNQQQHDARGGQREADKHLDHLQCSQANIIGQAKLPIARNTVWRPMTRRRAGHIHATACRLLMHHQSRAQAHIGDVHAPWASVETAKML